MKSANAAVLARYRLEKATRNLEVAREAFSKGYYEEAVGRSYYCIFSAMRSLLALKKLDSNSHQGAISLFGEHFIREKLFPRGFHKIISEAKDIREKAEYGDFVKVPKETAARHLSNAELFLNKVTEVLEKMLSEPEER